MLRVLPTLLNPMKVDTEAGPVILGCLHTVRARSTAITLRI
jgi:hypothetical protein